MSQKGHKGDVSYIRATGSGPYPPMGATSGGREGKGGTPQPYAVAHMEDFQWSEKEDMLSRELEEARIRTAQMEKTMRWWSDCTANWREKWNKARNERNKAREENRQLRSKLETAIKEVTSVRRERQDLTEEVSTLRKQLEHSGDLESGSGATSAITATSTTALQASSSPSEQARAEAAKSEKALTDSGSSRTESVREKSGETQRKEDAEKIASLKQHLQEVQEEKGELNSLVEQLKVDMDSLRKQVEEEQEARQGAMQELKKLQENHQAELERMTSVLEQEHTSTTDVDHRVAELRVELERLQEENAREWGRSEGLETARLALERENKQLRSKVEDLEEQVERRTHQAAAHVDADLRTLQFEVSEKNKELNELRFTHAKTKKNLSERTTELEHAKRRTDQYETEVKKLRGRIEELKRDLARAEDEVDIQTNSVRRLQRNNDELQEQVDALQIQVEHLTSRLRRSSAGPLVTGRASSLKSLSFDAGAGISALTLDSDTDDLDDEDT